MKKEEKVWTWEEIYRVRDREEIRDYVLARSARNTPYQKALILAFAVAKWRPGAPQRGVSTCALCVAYSCYNCPLNADVCLDLFSDWADCRATDEEQEKAADKMYNELVRLYAKAWEKL